MRLADLVLTVYREFDAAAAYADVVEVSRHDRYQASAGIAEAAAIVAERARAANLTEVTVHTFPADAATRWWTYQAPLSWTPVRARLRLADRELVCYPEQPYTLGAYSAATPPGGRRTPVLRWSAVLAGADPAGALVVLDDPIALPAALDRLTAANAAGIALDPLWTRTDRGAAQVGRVELPAGTSLFAFSLTPAVLAELCAAADAGAAATVEVVLDAARYPMPVVTALLAGPPGAGELLVTAHLCHPRPGANDNASGVAALLGVARVLANLPAGANRPGVRFVWGPEFVGTAAYLHDLVGAGIMPAPMLAVNVDMAGEDPRCGGVMVIERGPDDVASFLPALAVRCAALLPPAARSYSGAVPCEPWSWREIPFAGGSDHALVADAPIRCPSIACGHWPDRANHSSADTVELVDPNELRRTAAVAASVIAAVRGRADPALAADVAEATAAWAGDYLIGALPGRRPPGAPPPAGELLDPWDDTRAGSRLAHRAEVALRAARTLPLAGVSPARAAAVEHQVTALAAALGGWTGSAEGGLAPVESVPAEPAQVGSAPARPTCGGVTAGAAGPTVRRPDEVLTRCWPGPINLRALAASADPLDRAWLNERLAEDRGGNYARAVALLRGLDGVRDRQAAAWWAAYASELSIPIAFADRLFDLLYRAGWAAPARRAGDSAPPARGTVNPATPARPAADPAAAERTGVTDALARPA